MLYNSTPENINLCIQRIAQWEVVCLPTESVYWLAADATNPDAVQKIFDYKNRPSDNPLILHCYDTQMAKKFADRDDSLIDKLFDAFTPWPLTIVLKAKNTVPHIVTAWLDTVCIRIPNHPDIRAVIQWLNLPLAVPSANPSWKPSASNAHMAQDYFPQLAIIDGWQSLWWIESTVINYDKQQKIIHIIRPWLITQQTLQSRCDIHQPDIQVIYSHTNKECSPWTRYRHYAPDAPIFLFDNNIDISNHIHKNMSDFCANNNDIIIIAASSYFDTYLTKIQSTYPNIIAISTQEHINVSRQDIHTYIAQNMYQRLHQSDLHWAWAIYFETIDTLDLGTEIIWKLFHAWATKIFSP